MKEKRFCPYCQHKLSKKVIEDRQRLYCPQCQSPLYENPTPATAAVFFNEQDEVLLVKRKVEPKKGQWCLPGGFVEMEETPEECCLRELKEETNLNGSIDRLVGVYLSENPVYKSVLVIGYFLNQVRGHIRAGDDSEDVKYYPVQYLPSIAFKSHRSLIYDSLKVYKNYALKPGTVKGHYHFGAYVISSQNHVEIIEKACRAGARIVQYRDKYSEKKEILENAKNIRKIASQYRSLFLVNNHLDIAIISRADGIHLGQNDIPIKDARQMAPGHFIIGVSTHSLEQALEAEAQGADYIGIGPVFSTPTKKDYVPIGIELVKQVLKAVSIPVVAIGGLNLQNVMELKKIGIKNVALVRAFQQNTEMTVKQLNEQFL